MKKVLLSAAMACHQAAQKEGRESIFACYHIRVAQVLREYRA